MDNIRRAMIKIIILTVIIAILSASIVEAKKAKNHGKHKSSKYHHYGEIDKLHNKAKRSTYGRSWDKSYGNYGLPPYLVFNRKIGAYYPYFKYPENNIRRSMRKVYNHRQYSKY